MSKYTPKVYTILISRDLKNQKAAHHPPSTIKIKKNEKIKKHSSPKIRHFEIFLTNQKKIKLPLKIRPIKTFSKKTHVFFFVKQADITVYF